MATEFSVQPYGTYSVDKFTIWFGERLNSLSAGTAANYEVRSAGADGQFGTADDTIYPLTASYSAATNSVLLDPTGVLGQGYYRLTIRSGASGVRDLSGNQLNGGVNQTYNFTIGNTDRERVLAQRIGNLDHPDVATNAAGQSVVVWAETPAGVVANTWYGVNVDVMRFDATGQALSTAPLEIFTASFNYTGETGRRLVSPSVAIADDGRFVVAFEGQVYNGANYYRSIFVQEFNSDGSPGSSNSYYGSYDESNPDVAIRPDGTAYMVVFERGGARQTTAQRWIRAASSIGAPPARRPSISPAPAP